MKALSVVALKINPDKLLQMKVNQKRPLYCPLWLVTLSLEYAISYLRDQGTLL
jgi:hypothetical protein